LRNSFETPWHGENYVDPALVDVLKHFTSFETLVLEISNKDQPGGLLFPNQVGPVGAVVSDVVLQDFRIVKEALEPTLGPPQLGWGTGFWGKEFWDKLMIRQIYHPRKHAAAMADRQRR